MWPDRHFLIGFYAVLVVVAVVATIVRVAPLVEGGERLQRQCVSEDGYLMLTIARNIALGHGFSVSGGTIPSNGTQPLSALIYALCFWCVGGDRITGLFPVVGVQVVASILMSILIYVFTRRYLFRGPHAHYVALLAAVVWYASPTSVKHSQNSLETGIVAVLILSTIALYDALWPRLRDGLSVGACLAIGLLLGITFLGRNDACFLIAVMLLVHLYRTYRQHRLKQGFAQTLIIGVASVVVAMPWLWFNLTRFGHVVPISGRAEALNVALAHNLFPAFAAILENILLVIRFPIAVQERFAFQLASIVVLVVMSGAAVRYRWWLAERLSAGMGILACFSGALFIYYALFFGMSCFLGRYFFPTVTSSAIVGAAISVSWIGALAHPRGYRALSATIILSAVVVCVSLNLRTFVKGREHMHFQVVDWVTANVPETTWVGAVQTGTLGYYHDRTINLDGKVDPCAFAARKRDRISDYVIERKVEYLVDWAGIAEWAKRPEFAVNYALVFHDPSSNLAVLGHRASAGRGGPRKLRSEVAGRKGISHAR